MRVLWLVGESIRSVVEAIVSPIPGPIGYAVRWIYYKIILKHLGWGAMIDVGVRIEHPRTVSIGRRTWIDRNVLILGAVPDPLKGRPARWVRNDPSVEGRLVIGSRVHIASDCILSGLVGISLGDDMSLAAGTYVYSLSHHYRSLETSRSAAFSPRVEVDDQYMIAGPVEIGDRSGTGLRAIVLPGARLAHGAFLTIASVLMGDTEPGGVYSGNPARLVKPRADA